jgi:hypothetical protein
MSRTVRLSTAAAALFLSASAAQAQFTATVPMPRRRPTFTEADTSSRVRAADCSRRTLRAGDDLGSRFKVQG